MKIRSALGILVACVLLVMGGPSVGHAVTITTVTVDIAGSQFAGPFSLVGWGLPVVLSPGDSLILTQTAASPFNFDTSDLNCLPCNPTPTVTVNGFLFSDLLKILTFNGADDSTTTTNEANEWTLIGETDDFFVFVGYADNAHTNACADTSGNCLPDPFAASAGPPAVIFMGAGTTSTAGCLRPGTPTCFDAGGIMIVAKDRPQIPEPATLFLLGTGLVGVAIWQRKRLMAKK